VGKHFHEWKGKCLEVDLTSKRLHSAPASGYGMAEGAVANASASLESGASREETVAVCKVWDCSSTG
jgi:hypothetical protein